MGFNWPKEVEERPLVQRFDGKIAHFKDGLSAEVDVVMMCTGYLHKYDFLRLARFCLLMLLNTDKCKYFSLS